MKFEIMDNSCTFVVQVRQTCIITYFVMGFFMPVNRLLSHDIRLLYSRRCSLQYMCIGFGDFERHNSLSHFIIHISFMPNPMKYAGNAQGAIKCTCTHETGNSLVSIRNNQVVTTSLQVAEFFGKPHFHVLRDIRNLECSSSFQESNFGFSFYFRDLPNNAIKKEPMYYLTRDGFTLLVMGFTGKIAAQFKEAYINAFNDMEKAISRNAGEGEILKLLKTILDDNKKRANNHRKQMQERYGVKPGGEIIPPFVMESATLQENLRNIFAIVHNNTLEAQFYWTDRVVARKKLEALQLAVDEFTRKIKTNY